MSDTPRTDEQINGKPCTRFALMAGDSLRNALVPSEFARTLERELIAEKAARRDEESWWKEQHDYKARAERAESVIVAQDAYIVLLAQECSDLYCLAHAHHWKSSRVEAGTNARKRIADAKAALDAARATGGSEKTFGEWMKNRGDAYLNNTQKEPL